MRSNLYPSQPSKKGKLMKSTRKSSKPFETTSKSSSSGFGADRLNIFVGAARKDDSRRRVWKACERCRLKKTKCDGDFPCQRCKDDGFICTSTTRKKIEHKQLPKGYAEVLENAQLSLAATIRKLYFMVRNSQPWEFGEPDLNDRGLPVVQSIAQKLGCIRPNSDVDLPEPWSFPDDESSMAWLACQLEQQLHKPKASSAVTVAATAKSGEYCPSNDAHHTVSSHFHHSDFENQYSPMAVSAPDSHSLSPHSMVSGSELELGMTNADLSKEIIFSTNYPLLNCSYLWASNAKLPQQCQHQPQQSPDTGSMTPMQQLSALKVPFMINTTAIDTDSGIINPQMFTSTNLDGMIEMSDSMIYTGFDNDCMGL